MHDLESPTASSPLVSVLVTVYNRESFLRAALQSILDSTFQDFELIVVDDHSTDDSLKIANKMARTDTRIRVRSNEKNLGDYNNRNRAASFAQGKYLKYLDADDLIYRHSLSTMVEAMEEYPEAALALSSNIIDPEVPYPIFHTSQNVLKRHFLGKSILGVGPSAAIIRRDYFESVGGFSGAQFVGDTELWLKLSDNWPVVSLPPALVWWRRHEGQQMHLEIARPEVLLTRYQLQLKMLEETRHLTEDQQFESSRKLKHIYARQILSIGLRTKHIAAAWSLYKNSDLTIKELLAGFKKPNYL